MPSTLESLSQMVTPEMVEQVAKTLGIDPKMAQDGVKTVGPLLEQVMAQRTATPQGAQEVYDTVTQAGSSGGPGGLLGSLTGMLGGLTGGSGGGGAADGQTLVDKLLGAGRPHIEAYLKERTGMDVGPILAMAAPLVASALNKTIKDQNLDANGLANLLQSESRQFAAQNPETEQLIEGALQAGQQTQTPQTPQTPPV
jgi:hypothetical protein